MGKKVIRICKTREPQFQLAVETIFENEAQVKTSIHGQPCLDIHGLYIMDFMISCLDIMDFIKDLDEVATINETYTKWYAGNNKCLYVNASMLAVVFIKAIGAEKIWVELVALNAWKSVIHLMFEMLAICLIATRTDYCKRCGIDIG